MRFPRSIHLRLTSIPTCGDDCASTCDRRAPVRSPRTDTRMRQRQRNPRHIPRPARTVVRLVFTVAFCTPAIAAGQMQTLTARRTIFVGDIEGRVCIQDAAIYTRNGWERVFGEDGTPRFRIERQGENEVVVALPPGSNPQGPAWVSFRLYSSERTLAAAIITGEVDFARLISEAAAIEVERSTRQVTIRWQRFPPHTVELLCYNCAHPILGDRRVRVAIAQAIDREAIVREILGGRAILARGPYEDGGPLATPPGVEPYAYRPRQALQSLRAAGWADHNGDGILDKGGIDLRFELIYRKGVLLDEQVARQIKINLNELGIDVLPHPETMEHIQERLRSGTFEAYLGEQQFQESFNSFVGFFAGVPDRTFLRFRSNSFQSYVRLYLRATDRRRKEALVQALFRVLRDEQPVTFLYFKWMFFFVVNERKFASALDEKGRLRPFESWIVR